MLLKFFIPDENKLFSLFFLSSLTSALFYTGNNTWLFTFSYLFIIFNLILVLKQRFQNNIDVPLNGIFISSILLLLWFAISVFPSQIKYLSLYNLFWVGSLIITFLIFTFHDNKDKIWIYIWPAILVLVLLWAIYGLIQYYYLNVPSNATFLNRNSLAALVNLALLPASGYFLINEKQRPWKFLNNKVLTLSLILLLITIFVISSRGATLSLFFGFILLLSLLIKHIEKTQLYSLVVIIFISFLLVTISQNIIQDLPTSFTERMVTLQDTSKAGNSRFIMWESLLPLFKEMPWYGFGLGSLWVFWPPHRPTGDHSAGFFAHNDYMQITLEAGYPGIVLLILLFIFLLLNFIRRLKDSTDDNKLSLVQRLELISLFSALTTFAAHSFFTYNFYVLPLLLISGIYLARFNQLVTINSNTIKTFYALKKHFKPIVYIFSTACLILILSVYFISLSLSSYYNKQAKALMLKNKFQTSNTLFLKAQMLAPLMDNPFFSHADLLRRGSEKLLQVKKYHKANSLIQYAHKNLNKAEKLNPLRPQTFHIRGLIYERNQPEKAKMEFRKALDLDPRFLFSRIRLAKILYRQNQLKNAMEILYEGVNYNYPVNKVMLEYMTFFAKLAREAGVESFALHLEANIKKFIGK